MATCVKDRASPIEIMLGILKIVPELTMTNQAPLSLMNRLKKKRVAVGGHGFDPYLSIKSAEALPRYCSGYKRAGRTDGKTDRKTYGRKTPKQYPSAYGGG
ncbi:hypothetical protein DPMN_177402 [Dreissena polymorpha]|uniref:Uncharacterized protein n=1 Tax=Dreissena polymorpha TaxID=45954 RepID=A0A9D4EC36_DREPO|nr:hypothetical protein DPMN_177402 [Dreissena polymorpha]